MRRIQWWLPKSALFNLIIVCVAMGIPRPAAAASEIGRVRGAPFPDSLAGLSMTDSSAVPPDTMPPPNRERGQCTPSQRAATLFARAQRAFELDSDTIEGRDRIKALLQDIRSDRYYWNNPAYHMLWGEVFAKSGGGMPSYEDARRAFDRAASLDSTSIRARVREVQMAHGGMLQQYDRSGLDAALRRVREAVLIDPRFLYPDTASIQAREAISDHCAALYWASVLLCFARTDLGVNKGHFLALAEEARGYSEQLTLRGNHPDAKAWRIYAVDCLDTGRSEEAELAFRNSFDAMTEEEMRTEQPYFLEPAALRMNEQFQRLPAEEQSAALQAYWDGQDPTPLDLVNERELAYWRNVSIAMLYMPGPWNSSVGRAIILLGPPCFVSRSGGTGGAFDTPWVNTTFTFANGTRVRALQMLVPDPVLGAAHLYPSSQALVTKLTLTGPPVLDTPLPSHPKSAIPLFVNGASFPDMHHHGVDGSPKTVMRIAACAPWKAAAGAGNASVVFRLLAETEKEAVSPCSYLVNSSDIFPVDQDITPGGRALLLAADFPGIEAGHYTVEVRLERDGEILGFQRLPVNSKRFGSTLAISGLEPFVESTARWKDSVFGDRSYQPTAPVIPANKRVPFAYSVYGLSPDAGGTVRFQVTLRVVTVQHLRAARERLELRAPAARYEPIDDLLERRDLDLRGITIGMPATFAPEEYQMDPDKPLIRRVAGAGNGLDPGEYVLIVQIDDLVTQGRETGREVRDGSTQQKRSTAFTATLFSVVSAERYAEIFSPK